VAASYRIITRTPLPEMTRYYPGATSLCGSGKILRTLLLKGGPKGDSRVRVITSLYYDPLRATF